MATPCAVTFARRRGMTIDRVKLSNVVRDPVFPEPVDVIVAMPLGDAVKLVGNGANTSMVDESILTADKLALLDSFSSAGNTGPPSVCSRVLDGGPPHSRWLRIWNSHPHGCVHRPAAGLDPK